MRLAEIKSEVPSADHLLAEFTDTAGYTIRIYDVVVGGPTVVMGVERAGTEFITSPDGEVRRCGYWMDWPEDHWKISEKKYYMLSDKERAALEAKEQATRWNLKKTFDHNEGRDKS